MSFAVHTETLRRGLTESLDDGYRALGSAMAELVCSMRIYQPIADGMDRIIAGETEEQFARRMGWLETDELEVCW